MAFKFNGVEPTKIVYNGVEVSKVIYNGVEVWQSVPSLVKNFFVNRVIFKVDSAGYSKMFHEYFETSNTTVDGETYYKRENNGYIVANVPTGTIPSSLDYKLYIKNPEFDETYPIYAIIENLPNYEYPSEMTIGKYATYNDGIDYEIIRGDFSSSGVTKLYLDNCISRSVIEGNDTQHTPTYKINISCENLKTLICKNSNFFNKLGTNIELIRIESFANVMPPLTDGDYNSETQEYYPLVERIGKVELNMPNLKVIDRRYSLDPLGALVASGDVGVIDSKSSSVIDVEIPDSVLTLTIINNIFTLDETTGFYKVKIQGKDEYWGGGVYNRATGIPNDITALSELYVENNEEIIIPEHITKISPSSIKSNNIKLYANINEMGYTYTSSASGFAFASIAQKFENFNLTVGSNVRKLPKYIFADEGKSSINIRFEHQETDNIIIEPHAFYYKNARPGNIYTDNTNIKNYDWSGNGNITPTFYHLDGTAWE